MILNQFAGNPLVVGDALTPVWPKSVENLDTLRKMTKQTIHYKYQKMVNKLSKM